MINNILHKFTSVLLIAICGSFCFADTKADLQIQQLQKYIKDIKNIKDLEKAAQIKLEQLKIKYPHIFIRIALAENATMLGYFREEFNNTKSAIKKLQLLKEQFNIQ